jgi:hypothetical protein
MMLVGSARNCEREARRRLVFLLEVVGIGYERVTHNFSADVVRVDFHFTHCQFRFSQNPTYYIRSLAQNV